MQMVQEMNQRGLNGARQPRAATQGGHIFGGQVGRGGPYAAIGTKLNKLNQQKFAHSNMHDNSLSNGYLIGHSSGTGNVSPKYG